MSLHEELSLLLDDELEPEQAEALRARIATDPEVRAAWEAMCALPAELEALPLVAPPAHLDAALLLPEAAAPPSTRAWQGVAAVGWLAAAAAGLLTVWPGALPITSIDAAGVPVEVQGAASVAIDPDGSVEVAVRDGVARVGTGAARQTIGPGERRKVEGSGQAPRGEGGDQARIARLEAELARAREELREARFSAALTRGQLVQHRGEPVPWPDDLPAVQRPAGFEQAASDAFRDGPVQLLEVECSEFPCMATLSAPGVDEPEEAMQEAANTFVTEVLGDHLSMSMHVIGFDDRSGDGKTSYGTFWVIPAGLVNEDLAVRTRFRADALSRDLEAEAQR